MNINKTITTILLILCFIIAVPTALFFWKMPPAQLLPSEKELISFSSTPVAISKPKLQPVFSGLECPVKVAIKQGVAPGNPSKAVIKHLQPLHEATTKKLQPGSLSSFPTVSMIYSEGDTNVAIINGNILHEGSSFGNSHVLKIEKSRVLIRSAGKNIWLSMD